MPLQHRMYECLFCLANDLQDGVMDHDEFKQDEEKQPEKQTHQTIYCWGPIYRTYEGTNVRMYKCTNVRMCGCADARVHERTNARTHCTV